MIEREVYDPDELPGTPVLVGFFLFCAVTASIILGLTAYTYQLDDVKFLTLYAGGGLCLAYWAILWATRQVDSPPKLIWIPYVAYLAVCLLSTLSASDFAQWIGWQYIPYYLSAFGLVLLGSAVVQTKKLAEWSLKFWVLMTFLTTAFGLFHYAGHMETLYNWMYGPNPPPNPSRFHDLMYTFKLSRSMLSTVLNVQFFGNFLLMLLPVTAACAVVVYQNLRRRIDEHAGSKRIYTSIGWLVGAGLCVVMALACIFTTYSKSSIFTLPVILVLFAAGVYFFANLRRIPYLWLMVTLGVIMAATLLHFTIGDLQKELKNIDESMGPRRIIFGGAWAMFQDNWLLGGGPGSFRLLFPEYRDPFYHLHRVSNVTLYAHNWVLDLLSETGIIGTITYLAFLVGLLILAFKGLRRCPDMALRVAIVGGVVGLLSILAGALVTPMTRWPVGTGSLHAMIGSVLGIAILAINVPQEEVASARDKRRRQREVRPSAGAWTPERITRTAIAVVCCVFFLGITRWSVRAFESSMEHGAGWKLSELPVSAYNSAGVAEDPAVVSWLNRAVEHLQRAVELDPTRITSYYRLAAVYSRLDQGENALEVYDKMREYAPHYSEVYRNLGVIYYNLASAEIKKADAAENAEEKKKHEERVLELFQESAENFDKAAEQNQKIGVLYFQAYTHLHIAERLPEDSEEARQHFRTAGETFAKVAALPLSQVLQDENQLADETEQAYQSARMATSSLERGGAFTRAAEAAESYLNRNPTSLKALRDAVRLYEKAGQIDDSLRLINENLKQNPLNADALLLKIELLANNGRTQDAIEESKFVLALQESLQSAYPGSFLRPERERELRDTIKSLSDKGPSG